MSANPALAQHLKDRREELSTQLQYVLQQQSDHTTQVSRTSRQLRKKAERLCALLGHEPCAPFTAAEAHRKVVRADIFTPGAVFVGGEEHVDDADDEENRKSRSSTSRNKILSTTVYCEADLSAHQLRHLRKIDREIGDFLTHLQREQAIALQEERAYSEAILEEQRKQDDKLYESLIEHDELVLENELLRDQQLKEKIVEKQAEAQDHRDKRDAELANCEKIFELIYKREVETQLKKDRIAFQDQLRAEHEQHVKALISLRIEDDERRKADQALADETLSRLFSAFMEEQERVEKEHFSGDFVARFLENQRQALHALLVEHPENAVRLRELGIIGPLLRELGYFFPEREKGTTAPTEEINNELQWRAWGKTRPVFGAATGQMNMIFQPPHMRTQTIIPAPDRGMQDSSDEASSDELISVPDQSRDEKALDEAEKILRAATGNMAKEATPPELERRVIPALERLRSKSKTQQLERDVEQARVGTTGAEDVFTTAWSSSISSGGSEEDQHRLTVQSTTSRQHGSGPDEEDGPGSGHPDAPEGVRASLEQKMMDTHQRRVSRQQKEEVMEAVARALVFSAARAGGGFSLSPPDSHRVGGDGTRGNKPPLGGARADATAEGPGAGQGQSDGREEDLPDIVLAQKGRGKQTPKSGPRPGPQSTTEDPQNISRGSYGGGGLDVSVYGVTGGPWGNDNYESGRFATDSGKEKGGSSPLDVNFYGFKPGRNIKGSQGTTMPNQLNKGPTDTVDGDRYRVEQDIKGRPVAGTQDGSPIMRGIAVDEVLDEQGVRPPSPLDTMGGGTVRGAKGPQGTAADQVFDTTSSPPFEDQLDIQIYGVRGKGRVLSPDQGKNPGEDRRPQGPAVVDDLQGGGGAPAMDQTDNTGRNVINDQSAPVGGIDGVPVSNRTSAYPTQPFEDQLDIQIYGVRGKGKATPVYQARKGVDDQQVGDETNAAARPPQSEDRLSAGQEATSQVVVVAPQQDEQSVQMVDDLKVDGALVEEEKALSAFAEDSTGAPSIQKASAVPVDQQERRNKSGVVNLEEPSAGRALPSIPEDRVVEQDEDPGAAPAVEKLVAPAPLTQSQDEQANKKAQGGREGLDLSAGKSSVVRSYSVPLSRAADPERQSRKGQPVARSASSARPSEIKGGVRSDRSTPPPGFGGAQQDRASIMPGTASGTGSPIPRNGDDTRGWRSTPFGEDRNDGSRNILGSGWSQDTNLSHDLGVHVYGVRGRGGENAGLKASPEQNQKGERTPSIEQASSPSGAGGEPDANAVAPPTPSARPGLAAADDPDDQAFEFRSFAHEKKSAMIIVRDYEKAVRPTLAARTSSDSESFVKARKTNKSSSSSSDGVQRGKVNADHGSSPTLHVGRFPTNIAQVAMQKKAERLRADAHARKERSPRGNEQQKADKGGDVVGEAREQGKPVALADAVRLQAAEVVPINAVSSLQDEFEKVVRENRNKLPADHHTDKQADSPNLGKYRPQARLSLNDAEEQEVLRELSALLRADGADPETILQLPRASLLRQMEKMPDPQAIVREPGYIHHFAPRGDPAGDTHEQQQPEKPMRQAPAVQARGTMPNARSITPTRVDPSLLRSEDSRSGGPLTSSLQQKNPEFFGETEVEAVPAGALQYLAAYDGKMVADDVRRQERGLSERGRSTTDPTSSPPPPGFNTKDSSRFTRQPSPPDEIPKQPSADNVYGSYNAVALNKDSTRDTRQATTTAIKAPTNPSLGSTDHLLAKAGSLSVGDRGTSRSLARQATTTTQLARGDQILAPRSSLGSSVSNQTDDLLKEFLVTERPRSTIMASGGQPGSDQVAPATDATTFQESGLAPASTSLLKLPTELMLQQLQQGSGVQSSMAPVYRPTSAYAGPAQNLESHRTTRATEQPVNKTTQLQSQNLRSFVSSYGGSPEQQIGRSFASSNASVAASAGQPKNFAPGKTAPLDDRFTDLVNRTMRPPEDPNAVEPELDRMKQSMMERQIYVPFGARADVVPPRPVGRNKGPAALAVAPASVENVALPTTTQIETVNMGENNSNAPPVLSLGQQAGPQPELRRQSLSQLNVSPKGSEVVVNHQPALFARSSLPQTAVTDPIARMLQGAAEAIADLQAVPNVIPAPTVNGIQVQQTSGVDITPPAIQIQQTSGIDIAPPAQLQVQRLAGFSTDRTPSFAAAPSEPPSSGFVVRANSIEEYPSHVDVVASPSPTLPSKQVKLQRSVSIFSLVAGDDNHGQQQQQSNIPRSHAVAPLGLSTVSEKTEPPDSPPVSRIYEHAAVGDHRDVPVVFHKNEDAIHIIPVRHGLEQDQPRRQDSGLFASAAPPKLQSPGLIKPVALGPQIGQTSQKSFRPVQPLSSPPSQDGGRAPQTQTLAPSGLLQVQSIAPRGPLLQMQSLSPAAFTTPTGVQQQAPLLAAAPAGEFVAQPRGQAAPQMELQQQAAEMVPATRKLGIATKTALFDKPPVAATPPATVSSQSPRAQAIQEKMNRLAKGNGKPVEFNQQKLPEWMNRRARIPTTIESADGEMVNKSFLPGTTERRSRGSWWSEQLKKKNVKKNMKRNLGDLL
ncbi:unnamed protein product [Amoebophrya sp. A120]|nr:unnamed protein product [Amoebophrya sp. A120]|eukprot:GSA120T00001881001.1